MFYYHEIFPEKSYGVVDIPETGPSHDICYADIYYHQSCYLIFNKYSLLMNSEKEQGNGVNIEVEYLIMDEFLNIF